MNQLKALTITVFIFSTFASSITLADEVKAFVPEKPWQITINLNEFEPWDLLQAKTILGGRTKDGINITVIIEKAKPRTNPAEIRKLYGQQSLTGFGQKGTAERFDVDGVAVLLFKWAKQAVKNTWSYHGYVVKDDVAFDIHLSADMTKHTKKQMLDIIKSFQIKPSTELEECKKLYESLDENISSEEKVKLLHNFIKKYPTNPEAQFFLGEELEESKEIKNAYLKALDNHKIQPLINPITLLKCRVGLGMRYAISKEYDLAKQHLESGYNLGKKIKQPSITAFSAYILACAFAKTNDTQNSIKYLEESIKLTPRYKEKAKYDSYFDNIREDRRFRNIVGR